MNKKMYYYTVSTIFFIITLLHLLRVLNEWEAVVAGMIIPVWFSWVAVLLAGYMAVRGYFLAKEKRE